jgi:hypothetical protein
MTRSTPVPDEGELQLGAVRLPAGRQPVQTTAAEIVDAPVWYFWWD